MKLCLLPVVCASAVALLACGSSDSPGPTSAASSTSVASSSSSSGAGGSGGAGGGGGAGGCPADAHPDANGGCVATTTWVAGPKVPHARNHHLTWLIDTGTSAFLYVAGGIDDKNADLLDVERAPIGKDGTLGAWEAAGTLPHPASGSGVVVTHGIVALIAGYHTSRTLVAHIQPDGSLGAWGDGPTMPGSWFHTAAVTEGDWIYVVAGLDSNHNTDQVVRAKVSADGTISPYQGQTKLPYALSHHALTSAGNTLYVLGGETLDGTPRKDVLSSVIGADGSLGPWNKEGAMTKALETHAAFVHDGSIYVAGGIRGGDLSSIGSIYRATIGADMKLGAWGEEVSSALPHPRSHVHQLPIYQKWIYSVAGAPTGFPSTTDEVEIGTFQ